MRLALAFAAVASFLAAPGAYAQISCSEISRINMESADDFDALLGEEVDDDLYLATYRLSGANQCTVGFDWDSIYSCDYQFNTASGGYDARASLAATLRACLPGWRVTTVPASDAKDGYRTLTGELLAGTGDDNADLEWAAVLEEHTDTSGTHYHVWIELAYYW